MLRIFYKTHNSLLHFLNTHNVVAEDVKKEKKKRLAHYVHWEGGTSVAIVQISLTQLEPTYFLIWNKDLKRKSNSYSKQLHTNKARCEVKFHTSPSYHLKKEQEELYRSFLRPPNT